MKQLLDRWLIWFFAAVWLMPALYIFAPEVINWVGRSNLSVEKAVGLWLASHVLDQDTLKLYGWVEWGKDKLDVAIEFVINRIPPNRRAHTEALIHLRFQWHLLVVELMAAVFGLRALLRRLYRWCTRKRLPHEPSVATRHPTLPRAPQLKIPHDDSS